MVGRKRFITLDLLRGFLLIAVCVNHAQRTPGILEYLTGGGVLWVSGAELFFILSGFTFSYVRKKTLAEKGFGEVLKKSLTRALGIYVLTIIASCITLLIADAVDCQVGIRNGGASVCSTLTWQAFSDVATLQKTVYWVAMLGYYTLYVALAPLALLLLQRKAWYILLTISTGIFLLRDQSPILIYQLLFSLGLILGWYFRPLLAPSKKATYLLTLAGFWSLITYALSLALNEGTLARAMPQAHRWYQTFWAPYFDRTEMDFPRLAMAVLWFLSLFYFFTRFEQPINRALGWLLLPFGRDSLWTFALHAPLVFALNIFIVFDNAGRISNTLQSVVIIAVLYLLVWIKNQISQLINHAYQSRRITIEA